MSIRQVDGFLKLHLKNKSSESLSMALVVRMAYHSEGKQFKEFIQALEKG